MAGSLGSVVVLNDTYASAMAHGGVPYRHLQISDIRD